MCNKGKKIIFILLLLIFFVFCISNIVFADNFNFNQFDGNTNASANNAAGNIVGTGIQVVKIVGYGISIVMLSYIGIKYMIASPTEKADLKKSLIIFAVGAILVFVSTQILTIIANFASNNGLA